MNSLILLVLLFGCGNNNRRSCGCESRRDREGSCPNGRDRENGRDCGNSREENDGCGCRQEGRLDSRPFISYPGQGTCGCESSQNN